MYIPALDVINGLPEIDIEEEMEDVAQMQYSVQMAKDTHLRKTFNQYRLSELSTVVFTDGSVKPYEDSDLDYGVGSMYLRYGSGFESLISSTPSDRGMTSSGFPECYEEGEFEDISGLTDETWELLAEVVEWGNAEDESVECPVEAGDFPVRDRWFAFNTILMSAYGPKMCPPEIRILLSMAEYKAGTRDDVQIRDL